MERKLNGINIIKTITMLSSKYHFILFFLVFTIFLSCKLKNKIQDKCDNFQLSESELSHSEILEPKIGLLKTGFRIIAMKEGDKRGDTEIYNFQIACNQKDSLVFLIKKIVPTFYLQPLMITEMNYSFSVKTIFCGYETSKKILQTVRQILYNIPKDESLQNKNWKGSWNGEKTWIIEDSNNNVKAIGESQIESFEKVNEFIIYLDSLFLTPTPPR